MNNIKLTSQLNLILSVCIIGFFDLFLGCFTIFSSVLLAQLQDPKSSLKVNATEASWIASISALISPLGQLIIGTLSDRIGRRRTLHVTYIAIMLSWLTFAFFDSYEAIIVGRIIQGFTFGANTLTYMYVGEICLANQRPLFVSLVTLLVGLGMTFQCVLAVFFHWHTMSGILLGASVIGCAILFLVPESPAWLRTRGRVREAEAAEEWFGTKSARADVAVVHEVDSRQAEVMQLEATTTVTINTITTTTTTATITNYTASGWSMYAQRIVWLPTLVMSGFFMCQQLSGLYVLLSYSAYVLRDFQVQWDGITVTAVLCAARVAGSMAFSVLHGIKRRTLVAVSGLGMATSLLVIMASKTMFPDGNLASMIPVTAFVAFVFFSMLGLLPLPFIYCSEVFPTAVKGTLNGVVLTYQSLMSFIVIKMYPMVVLNLGIQVVWSIFTFVCVSSAFYSLFILPETKGKSLNEVLMTFESRKKTTNKK